MKTSMENFEENVAQLIVVLIRRRYVILAVFLGFLAFSVLMTYLSDEVYEGSFTVSVGVLGKDDEEGSAVASRKPIEMPASLKVRILGLTQELTLREGFINEVKIDGGGKGPNMQVFARGGTRRIVERRLKDVSDWLMERHDKIYRKAFNIQKNRLDLTLEQIDEMKLEMDRFDDMAKKRAGRNELLDVTAGIERLKTIEVLYDLERRKIDAEDAISSKYFRPTKMAADPFVTPEPIEPRKRVMLVMGVVGGILFAFLSALFVEFAARTRKTWQEAFK